ncbi:MFS transporter [Xylanimonas sp. McL0601]|uniref:MFS transporter n=1 Tax=Xylanimonas sp. McL0601 TaxID=3414739 RepID=UPI003CF146C5
MSTSVPRLGDPASFRRTTLAAWSVFAVFAASGATFATWASRVPAVRDSLGFTGSEMGLLLLTGAIGSVAALPMSGLITARLGAARAVLTFALVAASGYALVCVGVETSTALAVRIGLAVSGIGIGVWDAAMNLEGAVVEQRLGRAIMPRFHAGFSLGTVLGAAVGALVAHAGVPFALHVGVAVAITTVAAIVAVRGFLPTPHTADREGAPVASAGADPSEAAPAHGLRDTLAAWRERRTLLIGVVVLAAALTEGAANDWTSLSLVDGFGASQAMGALGLAIFLTAMTVTRLLGTSLIDRFGRVAVLRASSVAALVGVGTFAFAPWLWLALVGSLVWGASAAMGFPMGMSAASDEPRKAAMRVAVVSTIGYAAFFVGPALIGFVAEHTGYRHALAVIAVPVVIGLLLAGSARPPAAERQA